MDSYKAEKNGKTQTFYFLLFSFIFEVTKQYTTPKKKKKKVTDYIKIYLAHYIVIIYYIT